MGATAAGSVVEHHNGWAGATVTAIVGDDGPEPASLGLLPSGVEDRGPGIDPDDHERVFQRFWRGDPAESRAQGRSGLGLTIVRQTAEAHGGEVKLASRPGEGAAFALWLPAVAAPDGAEPPADVG